MSVLVMTALVTFPAVTRRDGTTRKEIKIRKISEATIEQTWKEMWQRASVTLPRNVKVFDKQKVKEIFRADDPVIIELGYHGNLIKEFEGYISQVSANMPIVIKCEDEMRMLARVPVNYSATNVTLDGMLRDICKGYKVNALEGVKLGDVRFSKTTVGAVLKKLQSVYKLYSYMRGKELVCGKYYSISSEVPPVILDLERNVVSNNLNYRNKEDIILKIKAASILKNGNKIEYEMGEEGGDNITLNYYNIEVRAELERKVKADYEKRKQDGFEGEVTLFGIPSVTFGMKAQLSSYIYPDRNGTYYIDGVVKTFAPCEYRQKAKLGDKAT